MMQRSWWYYNTTLGLTGRKYKYLTSTDRFQNTKTWQFPDRPHRNTGKFANIVRNGLDSKSDIIICKSQSGGLVPPPLPVRALGI